MASGGAFVGEWGGSAGAWGATKQQPPAGWQTAGDGGLIKPAVQLSEVDLYTTTKSSTPATSIQSISSGFNRTTANLHDPANTNAIAAREAAIARKEAELLAKEKDLVSREAELRRAGARLPRKNWPPCLPVMHHDIAGDIPTDMQGQVRLAYWCYLGLVVCLVYNFAGACAMVALHAPDRMSSWFLATIYCIAGIPLAMVFWYNKLYNTAAQSGSLGYLGFFIGFCLHVAFCTWAAIAAPLAGERWSFTGWVAALRAFDVSAAGGIIFIIGSCLWSLEALVSFWCLKTVYFSFRSGGKQQHVQGEVAKVALKAALAADNKV